jgi:hypothetical protein
MIPLYPFGVAMPDGSPRRGEESEIGWLDLVTGKLTGTVSILLLLLVLCVSLRAQVAAEITGAK